MNDKASKQIKELSDQKSIVKFEFANDTYIILFKSGNDFWNVTMHSALFLKFWLKVSPNINLTNDKYYKLDYRPYLAIHKNGLSKILSLMVESGCKGVRKSDEVLVYRMPQAFGRKQISEWNNSIEVVGQKLDDYFLPSTGGA